MTTPNQPQPESELAEEIEKITDQFTQPGTKYLRDINDQLCALFERYASKREVASIHKIRLCLIGKYAGDPVENALEVIAELQAQQTESGENHDLKSKTEE